MSATAPPPVSPATDPGGQPLPRDADDAPPTLAAVLAGHDHLFVTGGPGAGKTTLGRHLVRQMDRCRLREPDAGTPWCPQAVVAVRVTAAGLLTPHAWSRQLSDAVARAGTLLSPDDRSHFETRPRGALAGRRRRARRGRLPRGPPASAGEARRTGTATAARHVPPRHHLAAAPPGRASGQAPACGDAEN
ncbi:hypothetical protein [Streptomyces sp. NPDC051546]|uniref:hypothetical protein n=1 Tax=Streptomyces sp. NPDC051546 TaxID=3365655 RepID=UPI0037B0BDCA